MSNIRHLEFTSILEEAIRLKKPLPNIKEIVDPQEALNILRFGKLYDKEVYEFTIQEFDPPKGTQKFERTWYPKIFLHSDGMTSQFDGSGSILCTPSGRDNNARVFTFFICDHDWDTSGANHSRGWHPKRCLKCGYDASVDSGD